MEKPLVVSVSPHFHSGKSVSRIMWSVFFALFPAAGVGVYSFGFCAFKVIVYCLISSVGIEVLWSLVARQPVRVRDGSSAVTGLLLALNLPPTASWWLCVLGSLFAIVVTKMVFGGLGQNIFNPALAARVFLLISFPSQMTRWAVPLRKGGDIEKIRPDERREVKFLGRRVCFYNETKGKCLSEPETASLEEIDVITSATPLAILKEDGVSGIKKINLWDAFLGHGIGGSLGEVSAFALLLGGLYLLLRRYITWHIPLSFIGTVALIAGVTHILAPSKYAGVLFHLFTGGVMIGAFFMATDYVTSPMYPRAKIVFGIGCGVLTMLIRLFGGYPEGVSFSILFMNAVAPILDRYMRPKKFGLKRFELMLKGSG